MIEAYTKRIEGISNYEAKIMALPSFQNDGKFSDQDVLGLYRFWTHLPESCENLNQKIHMAHTLLGLRVYLTNHLFRMMQYPSTEDGEWSAEEKEAAEDIVTDASEILEETHKSIVRLDPHTLRKSFQDGDYVQVMFHVEHCKHAYDDKTLCKLLRSIFTSDEIHEVWGNVLSRIPSLYMCDPDLYPYLRIKEDVWGLTVPFWQDLHTDPLIWRIDTSQDSCEAIANRYTLMQVIPDPQKTWMISYVIGRKNQDVMKALKYLCNLEQSYSEDIPVSLSLTEGDQVYTVPWGTEIEDLRGIMTNARKFCDATSDLTIHYPSGRTIMAGRASEATKQYMRANRDDLP